MVESFKRYKRRLFKAITELQKHAPFNPVDAVNLPSKIEYLLDCAEMKNGRILY
jgi:hypothetical protein